MIWNSATSKVLYTKTCVYLYLVILMTSCENKLAENIVFVNRGVPSDINIYNIESNDSGYLEAEKESSSLTTKKAIFGDQIALKINLSVSDFDGTIKIIFGANTFSIINNTAENGIFLHGASIGKSIRLGEVSDLIQKDVPFELTISYDNEILTYTIDNK